MGPACFFTLCEGTEGRPEKVYDGDAQLPNGVPGIVHRLKWGTLGRAQDRASAASRNDVWVRSLRPPTDYIKKNGILPVQFMQVLTSLWYSHTYSLSCYRAKSIRKTGTPPK
jgi:hypothetical protein